MHLASGKEITHPKIAPVPMTQEVVKRVESLARKDGIPTKLSFIFRHRGKFMEDPDALLAGVETTETQTQQQTQNENDDNDEDYENDNQDNIHMNDTESVDLDDMDELKR